MAEAPYILPELPDDDDMRGVLPYYELMLTQVMGALAERYERDPVYRLIDTKLDLLTGKDFSADDPIRGKGTVYGWIQGRGLEALAGHCAWLRGCGRHAELRRRLEGMMKEVSAQLREMRERNGGHLHFFMTPEGEPFRLDSRQHKQPLLLPDPVPYGLSDLFCARGMFAAARYLEDGEASAEMAGYVRAVTQAVQEGTFRTDQQTLDPKNPVEFRAGKHSHSAHMLQTGAATLLVQEGFNEGVGMGIGLIRHILDHHVNIGGSDAGFEEGDFREFIDDERQPYCEGGCVLSDPGHALEFVGLALKFTRAARKSGLADAEQRQEVERIESCMAAILARNFKNGYMEKGEGICKTFDLVSRQPVNTDMPWWSLPETIRASVLVAEVCGDEADRRWCLAMAGKCHNAFVRRYVRPEVHYMAIQTRAENGEPVDVIPGTSDADPGYHTGLSLIDVMEVFATSQEK